MEKVHATVRRALTGEYGQRFQRIYDRHSASAKYVAIRAWCGSFLLTLYALATLARIDDDKDMTETPAIHGPSIEQLLESGMLQAEVLHPGGLEITRELANLCGIGPGKRVLDVASGSGEAACFLAKTFQCHVLGRAVENLLKDSSAMGIQRSAADQGLRASLSQRASRLRTYCWESQQIILH